MRTAGIAAWRRSLAPARLMAAISRRLENRGDSEHEQALIRVIVIYALFFYAWAVLEPSPWIPAWMPSLVQLNGIFLITSLAHFMLVVIDPAVRPARRFVGMFMDHSATIAFMWFGGPLHAVLYPLILWITLGYGFRYGRRELIVATAVSLSLFPVLLILNPFWQSLGAFAFGLWGGLLLVPAYCLRLLTYLHDARSKAEASNEAKSRFIAAMSHELRTPLNAIIGMTDLLRGTNLAPDQRDMARTVNAAAHGLLNTIEDVLDIAKIEAGAQQIRQEIFRVHSVFLDIRDLLQHEARHRDLALSLRLSPDLPLEAYGPKRALHQILINLVGNALKFTERGEVRIEGDIALAGDGRTMLIARVIDTGPGIAPEDHARIFENFAQLDQGTKRRYSGTGLGLAIVTRTVEHLRGEIRLDSDAGKGATFEVCLPITAQPEGAVADKLRGTVVLHGSSTHPWREAVIGLASAQLRIVDARDPSAPPHGTTTCADVAIATHRVTDRRGIDLIVLGDVAAPREALVHLPGPPDIDRLARSLTMAFTVTDHSEANDAERVLLSTPSLDVLVADDNTVNRQVIRRILERAGHLVALAENGSQALTAIRERHLDAAVIDLNMPDVSGLDVARAARLEPNRPRLIALTADATVEARTACLEAGFEEFLTKPIDSSRLLSALHVAADERAAAEAATARATTEHKSPPQEVNWEPKRTAATAMVIEADDEPDVDILDDSRLELLRALDDDDDFAVGIIDAFLADGRSLLVDLDAAVATQDLERFRDTAHALRSSAAHLGANALFQSCLTGRDLTVPAFARRGGQLVEQIQKDFVQAEQALLRARQRMLLSDVAAS